MSVELKALAENLSKRTTFSPEELKSVTAKFKRREVAKKEFLLQGDRTCNALYYIFQGCCKSYILNQDQKARVIMFAFTDWWITDIDSFTNGTTSSISIQASANSIVYELSKYDFDELMTVSTKFESAFRKMMQYSYIREQRRSLELITDDAQARYINLTNRYPNIEQDASQKDIASYLGITPEFLSVMKKRLLEDEAQTRRL